MDLFNYLLSYFGINLLSESATFLDLLNSCIVIFCALFIFTFIVRSLFLFLRFGDR